MKETLGSEDAEMLEDKVSIIKRSGSVLIREAMRIILRDDHRNEILEFINSYKLLSEIVKIGDQWLENSLKFVIMGIKDPLVFLVQCIEKMRLIERIRRSETRSFQILQKYEREKRNLPTVDQVNKMKKNEKISQNRRRHSNVINADTLKKLLKKSDAAMFIKDKLSSYFNEPSEFEKQQLLKKKETASFKKNADDAVRSTLKLIGEIPIAKLHHDVI